VRAPACDARSIRLPWPDVTGPDATAGTWRGWLDQAWRVPELASAVDAASPDLARQVARIRAAGDVPDAAVRRATLAVLRYLLRGSSRATPFGLLAGIAPARIGPRAAIRAGTGHSAIARADATWLMGVIEALETDDGLLPRLTVVASDPVAERAGTWSSDTAQADRPEARRSACTSGRPRRYGRPLGRHGPRSG
jgi:hypothetical protein